MISGSYSSKSVPRHLSPQRIIDEHALAEMEKIPKATKATAKQTALYELSSDSFEKGIFCTDRLKESPARTRLLRLFFLSNCFSFKRLSGLCST